MNWLKSETCHAHGLGSPEYTYIKGMSEAAIEDVKYEIRNGPDGDRDGFREPRWTLLDELPPEVLAAKLKGAESRVRSAQHWLEVLGAEARAWERAEQIASIELCEVEGMVPFTLPEGVTEEMIAACKAKRDKPVERKRVPDNPGGSAPGYEEKRPVILRKECALTGGSCNCDPDTVYCPVHNGRAVYGREV